MMYLWGTVSYMKKIAKKMFITSLKSLKNGVGAGSGSISQRYGSGSGSAPKCHGSPTLTITRQNYFGGYHRYANKGH